MPRPNSRRFARASRALVLALFAWALAGCVSKPTMKLNHAEVSGVRITWPPSFGVLMTVYVDVYNPNVYDVAVRAVRGRVLLANRYTIPVDYRADGDGLWLPSDTTSHVAVPVAIPVDLAMSVLRESSVAPLIPYRFTGRADVTATRTFRLEKDDYSVDENGSITRRQIEQAMPF